MHEGQDGKNECVTVLIKIGGQGSKERDDEGWRRLVSERRVD